MSSITQQKATGSHYTPPELARFLSERIVAQVDFCPLSKMRILDPACGDGELLVALAEALPNNILRNSIFTGIEIDSSSIEKAEERLGAFLSKSNRLKKMDFLERYIGLEGQVGLFANSPSKPVDIVIANPPYVRTQNLGAHKAQMLSRAFGLKGRIDLYQVFVVAMTQCLKDNGIIGIITSNRFISTRSGASIRKFIAEQYEIVELIDLGDTKLFEAAVLPAILIARKVPEASRFLLKSRTQSRFVRIYESRTRTHLAKPTKVDSVYDVLKRKSDGEYLVSTTRFRLSTGVLSFANSSSEPWQMLTASEKKWIDKINSAAKCRISDLVKVRVGIKTTADLVFIRSDWNDVPEDRRPERCLLRPIFSHDDAGRWRSCTERTSLKKIGISITGLNSSAN